MIRNIRLIAHDWFTSLRNPCLKFITCLKILVFEIILALIILIMILHYTKLVFHVFIKCKLIRSFFANLPAFTKEIINGMHDFFYKQHFYKQRQAEIGKKSSKC